MRFLQIRIFYVPKNGALYLHVYSNWVIRCPSIIQGRQEPAVQMLITDYTFINLLYAKGNREPIGSRKLVTSKCVGKPGTII